jgi:hypothetical protein
MTHHSAEISTAVDHDNRRLVVAGIGANFLSIDELIRQSDKDTIEPFQKFDDLWTDLSAYLQAPILNDETRFSGYTGYRTVAFSRGMGRSALGFNLLKNNDANLRIIVAERRKIYSDDRRRRRYESEKLLVDTETIRTYPTMRGLRRDLGKMRMWVDRFLAAELDD